MIKLIKILSEIKIQSQSNYKKQILRWFIDGHMYPFADLLEYINNSKPFTDENFKDLILDYYGYDEDQEKFESTLKQNINALFSLLKPGEIYIQRIGELEKYDSGWYELKASYRYVFVTGDSDGEETMLMFTNEKF